MTENIGEEILDTPEEGTFVIRYDDGSSKEYKRAEFCEVIKSDSKSKIKSMDFEKYGGTSPIYLVNEVNGNPRGKCIAIFKDSSDVPYCLDVEGEEFVKGHNYDVKKDRYGNDKYVFSKSDSEYYRYSINENLFETHLFESLKKDGDDYFYYPDVKQDKEQDENNNNKGISLNDIKKQIGESKEGNQIKNMDEAITLSKLVRIKEYELFKKYGIEKEIYDLAYRMVYGGVDKETKGPRYYPNGNKLREGAEISPAEDSDKFLDFLEQLCVEKGVISKDKPDKQKSPNGISMKPVGNIGTTASKPGINIPKMSIFNKGMPRMIGGKANISGMGFKRPTNLSQTQTTAQTRIDNSKKKMDSLLKKLNENEDIGKNYLSATAFVLSKMFEKYDISAEEHDNNEKRIKELKIKFKDKGTEEEIASTTIESVKLLEEDENTLGVDENNNITITENGEKRILGSRVNSEGQKEEIEEEFYYVKSASEEKIHLFKKKEWEDFHNHSNVRSKPGGNVIIAGVASFKGGKAQLVCASSGHYQPAKSNSKTFLAELASQTTSGDVRDIIHSDCKKEDGYHITVDVSLFNSRGSKLSECVGLPTSEKPMGKRVLDQINQKAKLMKEGKCINILSK